ncbi:MAG: hypothetical protein WCV91_04075 [Candidatus Margulisiibacteriota bacterium]
MIKRIFLIALVCIGILIDPYKVFAISQADDAAVIGGGARPLGMGRAFVAISDDSDAPFINPAGIANLKRPQALTMFTSILNDVYYSEYNGALPSIYGTFAIGYITTGVNDIPYDDSGLLTNYYDDLFVLSYSSPLSRFFGYSKNVFVGLNYKLYSRGYTGGIDFYGTGMNFDLGLKYVLNQYLSFGLCQQNVLPASLGGVIRYNTGASEALVKQTKIGVAIKPIFFNGNILLAMDADLPSTSGRPMLAHLGGEWKVVKGLELRAGLDQSVDPSLESRAGWSPSFGLSLGALGLRIDYAYHPYYNNPELTTNYVSISYTGEPVFALKGGPTSDVDGSSGRGN